MALDIAGAHALARELVAALGGNEALREVVTGIEQRLHFLLETGLGYLTLDRDYATLSGGEAQRVRLATQLGMGLIGVIYVLDEPSIGLHPHDNQKLLATLAELRDRGNTVLVVEHDEDGRCAQGGTADRTPGPGAWTEGAGALASRPAGCPAWRCRPASRARRGYLARELAVMKNRRHEKLLMARGLPCCARRASTTCAALDVKLRSQPAHLRHGGERLGQEARW